MSGLDTQSHLNHSLTEIEKIFKMGEDGSLHHKLFLLLGKDKSPSLVVNLN
jgi:hypothetical protein